MNAGLSQVTSPASAFNGWSRPAGGENHRPAELPQLDLHLITQLREFDALHEQWETAAAADPHASIFVSWSWLRGWFEECPHGWMVVAARPHNQARHVAFLPLGIDPAPRWFRFDRQITLQLGAYPVGDCTGFVCQPAYETQALAAFAHFVDENLDWDRFDLAEVSDARVSAWLQSLEPTGFDVERRKPTPCPQIVLPGDWETYLEQFIGAATRKTLRRRLRALENMPNYRVTDVHESNVHSIVDTMLKLWSSRWPEAGIPVDLDCLRSIFLHCFESQSLWVRVLWHDSIPIAAAAGFIDRPHSRFSGYILGVNPDYRRYSPGTVLIAQAIRDSIERGLTYFDFLRGSEAYKYSFGATDRFNQNLTVSRHRLRTALRRAAGNWRDFMAVRTRTRAIFDRLRGRADDVQVMHPDA